MVMSQADQVNVSSGWTVCHAREEPGLPASAVRAERVRPLHGCRASRCTGRDRSRPTIRITPIAPMTVPSAALSLENGRPGT